MDNAPEHEHRIAELYLEIINRYRDHIEAHERLSVADMPSLVTPDNEAVRLKAEWIKSSVAAAYDYSADFYKASLMALEFVGREIERVIMPVRFWLLPEETLRLMAGDDVDKCTLLCSLLISMGNQFAKVLIHAHSGSIDAFVYFPIEGAWHLFSPDGRAETFADKESVFVRLGKPIEPDSDDALYDFNNIAYDNIV